MEDELTRLKAQRSVARLYFTVFLFMSIFFGVNAVSDFRTQDWFWFWLESLVALLNTLYLPVNVHTRQRLQDRIEEAERESYIG